MKSEKTKVVFNLTRLGCMHFSLLIFAGPFYFLPIWMMSNLLGEGIDD